MWKFSTRLVKQPGAPLGPDTTHPKMVRWAVGLPYYPGQAEAGIRGDEHVKF